MCSIARLCPTLCNSMDCSLPGSFCPWHFPGKNTGAIPPPGDKISKCYFNESSQVKNSVTLVSPSSLHCSLEVKKLDPYLRLRMETASLALGRMSKPAWTHSNNLTAPSTRACCTGVPHTATGSFISGKQNKSVAYRSRHSSRQ